MYVFVPRTTDHTGSPSTTTINHPLKSTNRITGTVGFSDVDVVDTAALEKAIKGMGKLQGLAYCVGSINLKPLVATTTDDFIQVFTYYVTPP